MAFPSVLPDLAVFVRAPLHFHEAGDLVTAPHSSFTADLLGSAAPSAPDVRLRVRALLMS